jgi:hypothetical protein
MILVLFRSRSKYYRPNETRPLADSDRDCQSSPVHSKRGDRCGHADEGQDRRPQALDPDVGLFCASREVGRASLDPNRSPPRRA